MSDVQFDEQQSYSPQLSEEAQESKGIIGFLIKRGIAKDEQQANYILLGVFVVAVCMSGFLFFQAFRSPSQPLSGSMMPIAEPSSIVPQ